MDSDTAGIELAFTELQVFDWAAAVRWYVEVLGLHKVVEDEPNRFALLAAGSARLALKGGGVAGAAARNVRLIFRVHDVDHECSRLRSLGVDVGPPEDNRVEHYRKVSLRDPDGTPITLFSWLDTPETKRDERRS